MTFICDLKTGVETHYLRHEADAHTFIAPMAYSPSGRFLVVGGAVHETLVARVWNLASGKTYREFSLPIPTVKFFRTLAGKVDGKVVYFNIGIQVNHQRTGTLAAAFSPDGKTVATTTEDKIYLWELATGQLRCRLSFPENHIRHLAFSPSGLLMAGGFGVGQLLDWHAREAKPAGQLAAQELERLWVDLGSPDAALGHRAVVALAARPEQAAQLLGQRLRSIRSVDAKDVDRLIVELDDKDFKTRDRAEKQLRVIAEAVRPGLMRKLAGKTSAEFKQRAERLLAHLEAPPDAERLRLLRGVEVLEYLDMAPARQVLEQLATGMAGAVTTEEGRAALWRLKGRG